MASIVFFLIMLIGSIAESHPYNMVRVGRNIGSPFPPTLFPFNPYSRYYEVYFKEVPHKRVPMIANNWPFVDIEEEEREEEEPEKARSAKPSPAMCFI